MHLPLQYTGFLTEECDDTVIELSKLSLADSEFEVTVLDNFHETSGRVATARDYVLRRCNQTDPILFDECYPETVLKNCHKIGEGVYGEVFLWRGRDGRARVMKIVPIAGSIKVNGETQKDFHEDVETLDLHSVENATDVFNEVRILLVELSALRAPIADIDNYFDEGKDVETLDLHSVENATDVFNEVRILLVELSALRAPIADIDNYFDEGKDVETLDLHSVENATDVFNEVQLSDLRAPIADIDNYFDEGKDVETLDLHSVENATDVFNEVLAVRCVQGPYPSRLLDLWDLYDECKGSENDNPAVLPCDQQYIFATFVLRGRTYRVPRGGVAATIIDYSLSRISLPLSADRAALYNDLGTDEQLFDAVGDYQFQVYRLMRDKLGNDWKSFEPYTNILWLHYTVDKMITALRYKRTTTKIHKHYIDKLKGIKERLLDYKSATEYVLTDIEI
ncbi:putative serine/threonine-protein kinase haspin-like protein [Operophtera brumata]|uniref:non-specific serine/threonine protein kinase n=1 Tax=Operophtera brumata TaxID=104452 RepID=A0A0L7LTH1_OPEBR|nr:putative serine/threonine-protein kinase haspin-like protein [Operophtera brumata]